MLVSLLTEGLLKHKTKPRQTMPRLPTRDIKQAYKLHNLLPLLLKECRSINSAQNELRWLREWTMDSKSNKRQRLWSKRYQLSGRRSVLVSMCQARSKGMPLQYILGDQPFGDLEILCEKGVLIPRFVPVILALLSFIPDYFLSKGQRRNHILYILASYYFQIFPSFIARKSVDQAQYALYALWISVLEQDAYPCSCMLFLPLIFRNWLYLGLILVLLRYAWPE